MNRKRFIFGGRVQGVGFRATAAALASNFEITGYVRNLADRTVELEAQGAVSEIEAFVTTLRQRMHSNIKSEDAMDVSVREGEAMFEIRR